MIIDSKTGFPRVYECISIDKELHVKLTFLGYSISLSDWFRIGHYCTVNRFSMLKHFVSYIKDRSDSFSTILSEQNSIQHYKPQGRPNFSSSMIRYALLLRNTSWQSYKLLLQQFPLPSLSLFKKIASGFIDSVKAAKLLLENESMSEDCVLLVDEMYLQKSVQFHSGNFIGRNEEGTLYKGIVVFMIVSLKKYILFVIRSSPDITITGEWLKSETDECLYHLQKVCFYVRAVISDDHVPNVRAFQLLLTNYNGDKNLFIYHPAYNETLKTCLFFDTVHLVKNIRNDLLN